MHPTFENLKEYRLTHNFRSDAKFQKASLEFIMNEENKLSERIEVIKKYDKSIGYDIKHSGSEESILIEFLNDFKD